MIHVVHFCRNKKCNNAWIDKDRLKSKRPPKWKACDSCVEVGFKNPLKPPVKRRIVP